MTQPEANITFHAPVEAVSVPSVHLTHMEIEYPAATFPDA